MKYMDVGGGGGSSTKKKHYWTFESDFDPRRPEEMEWSVTNINDVIKPAPSLAQHEMQRQG